MAGGRADEWSLCDRAPPAEPGPEPEPDLSPSRPPTLPPTIVSLPTPATATVAAAPEVDDARECLPLSPLSPLSALSVLSPTERGDPGLLLLFTLSSLSAPLSFSLSLSLSTGRLSRKNGLPWKEQTVLRSTKRIERQNWHKRHRREHTDKCAHTQERVDTRTHPDGENYDRENRVTTNLSVFGQEERELWRFQPLPQVRLHVCDCGPFRDVGKSAERVRVRV